MQDQNFNLPPEKTSRKTFFLLLGFGLLLGAVLLTLMLVFAPEKTNMVALENGGVRIGDNTIRISRHRLDMGDLPIKNLSEPVEDSDAATKGYVDAQAGAIGTCDGDFLYIKFTNNTYHGNLDGRAGGNMKCNAEFPGYNFCNRDVINDFGAQGCLPYSFTYGIISGWLETTDTNCISWTFSENNVNNRGRFIYSNVATAFWNMTGLANCGTERRLCCYSY